MWKMARWIEDVMEDGVMHYERHDTNLGTLDLEIDE